MNKATFSRLIKDSTYISDADVLALEQVVQAFPYCQTAHMLLAKAAADKGSMLAPQRLRKAAIHAPSRALLKKLVEGKLGQQESEQVLSIASGKRTQVAYNEELEDLMENDLPNQISSLEPREKVSEPKSEARFTQETQKPEQEEITEDVKIESTPEVESETTEAREETQELLAELTPAETEEEVAIAESVPEVEWEQPAAEEEITTETETPAPEIQPAEQPLSEVTLPEGLSAFLTGLEEQDSSSVEQELEHRPDLTEAGQGPLSEEAAAAEKETDEVTPNTSEAEEERNGIQEPEKLEVETEETAEATAPTDLQQEEVSESEELPEAAVLEALEPITAVNEPAVVAFTPANRPESVSALEAEFPETRHPDSLIFSIFRDSELGYAMSSSRMGESLQQKSELTREVPFHFQPELLVEYRLAKSGEPENKPEPDPKPEIPPQQDLIDDFLKQAAKSRPRANLMPKQEEQEDLSQKSTRLSKSIVSENLAQIFAMQGKTKKAIKIYQQLQLKMPEKKDYFAVLINKLQNHSS